jgi:hypothetical protein
MTVYANGRELSGKASGNKTIAAMPDVCLSPPAPPAGPIPIPYPNTSMASDTADGSKTVFVQGKEVGLKNASVYKKSNGNEPATNSFGAGVVSHVIQGKTKFAAWSFDVKIEGQNAVRHLDLTTTNHVNNPNTGLGPSAGLMSPPPPTAEDCKELSECNDGVRERMGDDSRVAVQRLSGDTPETPNTIAHAAIQGASAPASPAFAASRHAALRPNGNHETYGGLPGKKADEPSKVCGGGHEYPPAGAPTHLHSEARILEGVVAAPGMRPNVTFSIDWRNSEGQHNIPCPHCEKLIKHACKCMDIYLCDDSGEPQNQC